MKINLKNAPNRLSRATMKSIIAGNGASILGETAQVLCNDGREFEVPDCSHMDAKCKNHGGAKICSGGGN